MHKKILTILSIVLGVMALAMLLHFGRTWLIPQILRLHNGGGM